MQIPWGVVISLGVLALAYLIKKVFSEIAEEQNAFFWVIAIFLIIYAGAAIAVGSLNPLEFVHENLFVSMDETVSP